MASMKKRIAHFGGNIIAICVSLLVLIPLLVIFVNSFKTAGEANRMSLSLPSKWMFENYALVIEQGKLVSAFFNGLLYATCSALIIIVVVTMAAFVISRNQNRANRILYYFIISGIAIPINNVALMKFMQMFNLMNTRHGIILLFVAVNIPLSLFLAYGFVKTIPKELDESALLDGCNSRQLFLKIIIPLLQPIISTLFVLNFMAVWNDFMMPLYYLNNSSKWPMTLAVYNFFGAFENSWNLVSADIMLTLLPVLIVFILGQKYIVGGIAAGSVKG